MKKSRNVQIKQTSFQRGVKCVSLLCIFAFVFAFVFSVSAINIDHFNRTELSQISEATSFAPIDPNMPFDAFFHGSKYRHTIFEDTDYESYRNGTKSDTVEITVDRSQPHGTEANPYVISSTALWNTFASKMTAANAYGKNMHFVLAADLDFGSVAANFKSCPRLDGSFYGMGHTMSNIVIENSNNRGIFNVLLDGTLTDLNAENCILRNNIGYNSIFIWGTNSAKVLNCHGVGSYSLTTAKSEVIGYGGIVCLVVARDGTVSSDPPEPTYIYRCSAKSTIDFAARCSADYIPVGGIVGASFHLGYANILDSYSEMEITNFNTYIPYVGGIVGISFENMCPLRIENCAATVNVRNGAQATSDLSSAIVCPAENTNNGGWLTGAFNLKNIYVEGKAGRNNTLDSYVTPLASSSNFINRTNGKPHNFSNVKYGTSGSLYVYKNTDLLQSAMNSSCTAVSSATMWAEAQGPSSMLNCAANIWDTSKINNGSYSPESAPNRNKLYQTSASGKKFTAEFKNYKTSGDEDLGILSKEYNYGDNTSLPTPTAPGSNQKFVGWTTDKDDEQTPVTSMPAGAHGDITFYAVWDVDSMTTDALTADNSTVEYLLGNITLTADISVDEMTDATVTYKWKHDTTALGDTSSSITKENVADSGTYTLEYYIKSQSQPLWRHRGTHSETITITPGTLTPQSMTVDKTAYYGMTLSELAPTVVMHNSQGNAVNGTAAWRVGSRQITKDTADPNYQAGKAYAEFTFVPDSSYNGNYGTTANYNTSTTAQTDIVYFNVNELTVTFNTASIFGTDLSFVITSNYGDPVTYRTIATQFEQLYAQFSVDNPSDVSSLTGKTPQLKLNTDSQFYNINDYKAKSGGYNNVRASISIDVAFTQKFYSVTYKFDDGVTPDKIEGSKSYGQLLIKPSPDPTNGTNSFLGWFYPELDASGNPVYEPGTSTPKLKKWDFDVDRIVDDLVLTARWLQADSLDHIEVVAQKPSYNALDPLKAGDLTVTAYYNAKDSDGNPIIIPIPLSWSDYSSGITYVGNRPGDNVLHVDPNGGKTKIEVFYSFFNADTGTTTDKVTVEIVVDPIKIDLSALNLQTQTVGFNGSAKSYDLTLAQVQALPDPNVSYITGINFAYYLSRNEVQPADVKAIGNYDVVITFTTSDADYAVDPINVQLRIVDQSELPDPIVPGPDPSNGTNLWDKIVQAIENGFPLWQIATIAVGGILSIIFLIKSIQYGNRRKKAKGEAKKISTKTYAGLLPVFATDIVLAGLSNKIWSIIAFAMVGVTVLMFLIAIITRKGWKKAELAKEEAIEDREQRKFDAQEAKQLAFQERVTQVAQSGQGGIDSSIIEEMRREMEAQRRADEERHRQEMEALREEQSKRDEAMKIMLANMMGRQQGTDGMDMGYASMDNTDLLVQKVIAGLLPMVQQMVPEPTAYLAAPNEQNDRYDALMSEMSAMRQQLDSMSHNVYDAEIISDNSDEIRALQDEHSAQIAEQNAQIAELQSRIDELMQGRVEAELLPDQTEEIRALNAKIEELQQHIADGSNSAAAADNSEELRAMADAQNAKLAQQNAEIAELKNQIAIMSSMSVDELDDEDFDDEEEWDSILDEDDDDFVEAIIIDEGGKERKVYPNFRMRLKQSSDKNREWYAVIKNLFCSQKDVTYRVYKRVEKIRYQGQVIAVIGIAKRSIKLWLALKPYEYDARRYHHKDVSDKPRFVDVPMYVRVSSDRALDRSQELILALFQELNMEARKRYNDRPIQELIFTLKHNRLLTNKQNKQLLCEVMHVHDCDVLDDETAEKCIEFKNVESLDESNIETVKLDDIDAKFQDGNRVTLDRLKKVGLVSEDCTGFTVTADKRLTKPLIIVANDFTLTAVKLIALTGGRAIKLQTV